MKDQTEIVDDDDVVSLVSEEKKVPKEKKTVKVRSLKKQVASLAAQVKERLAEHNAALAAAKE